MTDRRALDDLKLLAERRAAEVLGALGIKLDRARGPKGRIVIENPMVKQGTPSFNVYTRNSICFRDFGTGDSGDLFGLIAACKGWYHLKDRGFLEAKRWLEDRLGVRGMSAEQRRRDLANARRQQAREKQEIARSAGKAIGRAQEIFYNAQPLPGTLAESYLRARGIDLDALPRGIRGGSRWPGSLRFLPRERHVWEGRADDRRNGEVSHWPCLVAACVDPASGQVRAIHRTWLTPQKAVHGRLEETCAKAPVIPPRKSWPAIEGLVIPLWKGSSNLSVRAAIAAGLREDVMLAEGIETTLSAVLADPTPRAWAVISLGNLANLRLPECIDGVLLSRENDWVKPQAVAQFEAGKRALERQGRAVAEIRAFGGNDLNDVLKGAA